MRILITKDGCCYGGRRLGVRTVTELPQIPPLWVGKCVEIEEPKQPAKPEKPKRRKKAKKTKEV